MKVYIPYSSTDIDVYNKIKCKLLKKDMLVLTNKSNSNNEFYESACVNIFESCQDGFVLLILSENCMNNKFIMSEINLTNAMGGKIIAINIGGMQLDPLYAFMLQNSTVINVSKEITDSELDKIVNTIMDIVVTD